MFKRNNKKGKNVWRTEIEMKIICKVLKGKKNSVMWKTTGVRMLLKHVKGVEN